MMQRRTVSDTGHLRSAGRCWPILAILLVAAAQTCAAEPIKSDAAKVYLEKPATWTDNSGPAVERIMSQFSHDDRKVMEAFRRGLVLPAILITKFREPYPDVNPSISVAVRRRDDPGVTALGALSDKIDRSRAVFQDVVVEQPPTEVTLGGRPAAHARVAYTMRTPGGVLPVLSEQWFVMRGDAMVMISAGSRPDRDDGEREEIRAVLDTLRFVDAE